MSNINDPLFEPTKIGLDQTETIQPTPLVLREITPDKKSADTANDLRPQLRFQLITNQNQLLALEDEWNELFDRCAHCFHVFQEFNWCWRWCQVFLDRAGAKAALPQLHVIAVRESDRLIAIWPLVTKKTLGLNCLSWIGAPVSQYGDVLIEDRPDRQSILEASLDYLSKTEGVDVLQFWKVRADAVVFPVLDQFGGIKAQIQKAPFVDLTQFETLDAYVKTLSKKRLRNRRRARRRLEEQGDVIYESIGEGPEAALKIATLLAFKRDWMRKTGLVSTALDDDRTDEFFRSVAEDTNRPTGLSLKYLTCGKDIVAMELGFRCKGRYVVHVITYNNVYQKFGAGSILSELTIDELMAAGVETVDFMAPGDAYKFEWCKDAIDVVDFARPLTVQGTIWVHVYLRMLRENLKKALAALPAGLRRTITSARRYFL